MACRALTRSVTLGCSLCLVTLLVASCAHERPVANYPVPYDRPLNSPGGKFSSLPPAVQNTIRAETGSAEIEDIVRDTHTGSLVYKVHFVDKKLFPTLYIAPDGSVLNPNLTVAVGAAQGTTGVGRGGAVSLKPSDLPPNVMRLIQDRAPHTEIAFIQKELWGDREVYVVSFKDPNHNPDLCIAADGTVLKGKP